MRNQIIRRAVYLALGLMLAAGCAAAGEEESRNTVAGSSGREPEATLLARVLGVDYAPGAVTVTAVATDPAGGEADVLLTASGDTLAQAMDALPTAGESWLALTHVTQLVLGDRADLEEVLTYVMNSAQMDDTATVWCAPVPAAGLLEECGGGVDRLTVLEQKEEVDTVTVAQALEYWREGGEVALPALAWQGDTLEAAGVLLFSEVL